MYPGHLSTLNGNLKQINIEVRREKFSVEFNLNLIYKSYNNEAGKILNSVE